MGTVVGSLVIGPPQEENAGGSASPGDKGLNNRRADTMGGLYGDVQVRASSFHTGSSGQRVDGACQGAEAQRGGWRGRRGQKEGEAESKEWQSWPIGSEQKQCWSHSGPPLALQASQTFRSPPPPKGPEWKLQSKQPGALFIVQARVHKDLGQWWWGYRGGDSPGAFLI